MRSYIVIGRIGGGTSPAQKTNAWIHRGKRWRRWPTTPNASRMMIVSREPSVTGEIETVGDSNSGIRSSIANCCSSDRSSRQSIESDDFQIGDCDGRGVEKVFEGRIVGGRERFVARYPEVGTAAGLDPEGRRIDRPDGRPRIGKTCFVKVWLAARPVGRPDPSQHLR